MSISALLLAASSIAVPDVSDATGLFAMKLSVDRLERSGHLVEATANLWVEPNGKVTKCSIGRLVGDEGYARSFCPMLQGRLLKFPRDSHGRKSYAFVSVDILARAGGTDADSKRLTEQFDLLPIAGDADAVLPLAGASLWPDEGKRHYPNYEIPHYEINVEVAADGSVAACEKARKTPQELADRACAMARAKTFAVRNSDAGQSVSYIRSVRLVEQGQERERP